MIELIEWARKDQQAFYNKAFISLINDVMKANSVKIACKQLDLSLIMNSVSLLISVKGRRGRGFIGRGGSSFALRKPVNTQKYPSANRDQPLGTHVDEAPLKTP